MSLISQIGLMQGTLGRINAQQTTFSGYQALTSLANQANPNMSSQDILSLNQQEKQIATNLAKAQINQLWYAAMEEYYQKQLKKEFERRQRAVDQGWLA